MLAALKRLRRSVDKQEATAILPDAKEVSTGTAEVDVLTGGHFCIKRRTKNSSEGFCWWKKMFFN